MPLVSVIVASHSIDRIRDVQELIAGLRAQTYMNFETIVVTEKSPELYARVAALAIDPSGSLKVVFNDRVPGLASNRNYGIQHARGQILAFIDDDAVPFSDWVEEIVRTFQVHAEAIGVTGPAYPAWRDEAADWLPEEFYWLISCPTPGWIGGRTLRSIRNAWGMNMAFRREAFRTLRFDSRVGWNVFGGQASPSGPPGEDTVFSLKVLKATGKRILYNPAVRVHHKVYGYRLKPEYVRRRAFWEGYMKATLVRCSGSDYSIQLSNETDLLRRILLGLLPRTIWQLLDRPAYACRRLSLAVRVLLHLSLGYAVGRFPFLSRLVLRQYS